MHAPSHDEPNQVGTRCGFDRPYRKLCGLRSLVYLRSFSAFYFPGTSVSRDIETDSDEIQAEYFVLANEENEDDGQPDNSPTNILSNLGSMLSACGTDWLPSNLLPSALLVPLVEAKYLKLIIDEDIYDGLEHSPTKNLSSLKAERPFLMASLSLIRASSFLVGPCWECCSLRIGCFRR